MWRALRGGRGAARHHSEHILLMLTFPYFPPPPAGDYPLPDEASSLGINDTLAQLSDLSQATVYQSATLLEVRDSACWGTRNLFHACLIPCKLKPVLGS